MKPLEPKRWLVPDLSEERTNRQWARISERISAGNSGGSVSWFPGWRGVSMWAGGIALATVLLGVATNLWPPNASRTLASAALNSAASHAAANAAAPRLSLADGSKITLGPLAELAVLEDRADSVVTDLRGGNANFAVTHHPERPFIVRARGIEVRVVGTQFDVEVGSETVTVRVREGVVVVRSARQPGEESRLHAGQTWSERLAETPSGGAKTDVATASPTASQELGPGAASAAPNVATNARGPKELFEQANAARRGGDTSRARALYGELLARHPDDARAKLAALELGRMELERSGGSDAAESSLVTATSSEPGSPLHEDALARLVQVYDRKGDLAACQRERSRYLAAYPQGVHASQVRTSCAAKP